MHEKTTITFTRYINDDEEPTCVVSFSTGKYCKFYATKNFGTCEVCLLFPDQQLERRRNGYGSLIPHDHCPLWKSP